MSCGKWKYAIAHQTILHTNLFCNTAKHVSFKGIFLPMSTRPNVPLTQRQVKHFCDVLGVPVTASEQKIKQAFYKRSFQVHPDRNKHHQSERAFTEISEAYQALLAHKKSFQHEDNVALWQKGENSSFVRPWFKTSSRVKAAKSTFSIEHDHHDDFNISDTATESSQPDSRSSAADWCHNFYKKQLQEDFALHCQNRQKDKSNDVCVVM
ncbi:uncharacterized protein LOC143450268 [Clavelina lepadiformis]|uniref:J domain-containing protein n=1 Tax=Clavelina lepadiformis TaxID=159417 RepID=A0ABP0H1I3_CLALP